MCLYVKNIPEDLNPEIATEDIPCFKLLNLVCDGPETYYITPFQNFRIDFDYKNPYYMAVNKMTGTYFMGHESSLLIFNTADLEWINGKNTICCHKPKHIEVESLNIYKGIHAFSKIPNRILYSSQQYFKAIIPKGAYYFIGINNEIVADKMIIFKEIADKALIHYY